MSATEGETCMPKRNVICHPNPTATSLDPVNYLPNEILWKIIGFLSAEDLCHLAGCNKAWRNVTNINSLWHRLCKLKDWERFGTEVDLRKEAPIHSDETSTSDTSPTFPADLVVTGDCDLKDLTPTCEWKEVYMRAWHLDRNWSEGHYQEHIVELSDLRNVSSTACDGRTFAAGDQFGYLRMWNLYSGCLLQKIQLSKSVISIDQLRNPPYYGSKESVRIIVLKNGIGLAAFMGGILVFESDTGKVSKTIRGTASNFDEFLPHGLHFEDNKVIASYEFSSTLYISESIPVHIWDISSLVEGVEHGTCTETKLCTESLRKGASTNKYLKCLACCKHFVVTSFEEDATIAILWDARTLKHIQIYKGHTNRVCCANLDDNTVMTADCVSDLRIWTTESDVCIKTLSTSPTNRIHSIRFNGKGIAALSIYRVIFWKRDGTLLGDYRSKVKRTGRIHGNRLVTQSLYNNAFTVWDVSTGKCLYRKGIGHEHFDLMHTTDTKIVFYRNAKRGVLTLQYC